MSRQLSRGSAGEYQADDRAGSKIYVSVLDKSDVKEVVKGLKSAGGYLRRELGRALSLRYTPELVFQADDSIDRGTHILKLLNDIERKEGGGAE